ncbi:MAG TPA: TldD/PmbA family protein [Candidatus Polarisedimenticolia bacterium]|nr:TldD/PmbA family protein [Candidatus Polarisedimenticolia bacterium]
MSLLKRIDRSFLRGLAASLAIRPDEYADLFLEEARQVSVERAAGAEGPVTVGAGAGAAARLVGRERVLHASTGSLESEAIEALAGGLRSSGGEVRAVAARSDEGKAEAGGAPEETVRTARAIGRYLEEVEAAALQAAEDRPVAWAGRGEARSQAILVATSEGEVAEDRRDWVSFTARLAGGRRGGETPTVSEGGGARDIDRLRALHPPAGVGARLAASLREQRDATPPPSGEMTVVLAPGPGGIFFHEACGHALEGDRALKGRSLLVDLLGEEIGPRDLTLVDDPTLPGLPGSRRVDDEGWPASRTVLIDSGRVVGLLLDRATALLAETAPTGSARRESYRDLPLPRMTNTFVLAGAHPPEEILASVMRGLYVAELGGGEVDTVTADFSFRIRRGYLIAGGRLVAPLLPSVVAGNGLTALRGIRMIGNDLKFDPGAGECGKEGQRVRAGVGQPTIKVEGLAVRRAAAA